MKTVANLVSGFLQKQCTPWWADIGDEAIVIRDCDGKAICAMPRADDLQERDNQEAIAQLLAMAPEAFANLYALLDVMRRSDPELTEGTALSPCSDEDWLMALAEGQALIELLAEDGMTLGEVS